jgi:hypothetical protein
MGVVEGNQPVSDNDWEAIKGRGEKAIQEWIDGQLKGRSCTIVLIGAATAGRKWIKYEIEKSWNDGKGVLGIYIHNLEDREEKQSSKGGNPFADFSVSGKLLSTIVKAYDPPYSTSANVYSHIKSNLEKWVEEAVSIRENY